MTTVDRGFSKIEREHVELACKHLVASGTAGKAAGSYCVRYEGQEISAKNVVREAFRFANDREISSREFSGGQFVARILRRLGFEVIVRGAAGADGG